MSRWIPESTEGPVVETVYLEAVLGGDPRYQTRFTVRAVCVGEGGYGTAEEEVHVQGTKGPLSTEYTEVCAAMGKARFQDLVDNLKRSARMYWADAKSAKATARGEGG